MANLQSTNVVGTLCVNGVAVGGGKDYKYCCFTGSTTWTPSSDLVDGDGIIKAHIVGAGGGGGGSWGWAVTQTIYQNPVRTSGGTATAGDHGAAGNYIERDIFITSTDACTVTIGAGGTGGAASGDATCTSINTVCDSLVVDASATDGGNTTFGGFTAYGGCAGQTRAWANRAQGCQGPQNYCATDTTTVTNSGLGGAWTCYRQLNTYEGNGFSSWMPSNITGSAEISLFLSSTKGNSDGGIGVEGVSLERRCGVFGGCNIDGNRVVAAGQNGVKTSQTYGNGGVRGSVNFTGNSPSTPLVYFGSGSAANDGIVVLQWSE